MLTYKLWHGFKRPFPEHPLYQRVVTTPNKPMPWYVGCAVILVAPFLLLPAFVFMSAIYALRWAVTIATTITHEHETGMYDLVSLTTSGPIGCCRAISTACLHRNESMEQIQSPGAWIMRIVFSLVLMLSVASLTQPILVSPSNPNLNLLLSAIYLLLMAVAIYIDHVHSIIVGILVGILTPTYATNRLDAGFAALLVFLLIQVTTYMLTLILGFVALPNLLEALAISAPIMTLLLAPLRLVIFFALREWLVRVLWKVVVKETNAAPTELDFMTR